MELAEILRVLWRRRLATLAIVLLAGGGAYGAGQLAHSTPTGSATVQVLVDSPQSALADLLQSTAPLTTRATLLAQVMASQTVLEGIAASAGVPVGELTAQGPYSGAGQALDVVTPAEARSNQLLGEGASYRLVFVAQTDEPVITASVQGPTAATAGRVAEAVYPGVQRYIAALQQQAKVKPAQRLTIRQLGPAQASTVNSSSRLTLMAVAALAVLLLGLLALLAVEALRRRPPDTQELERDFAADLDRLPREERSRSVA
jgi:capsular polysaccharide biosynthesis protein